MTICNMNEKVVGNFISKLGKIICYLLLVSIIGGYTGIGGWMFYRIIALPTTLDKYARAEDVKDHHDMLRNEMVNTWDSIKAWIAENKKDGNKRIDGLEEQMEKRFDKLEGLIRSFHLPTYGYNIPSPDDSTRRLDVIE